MAMTDHSRFSDMEEMEADEMDDHDSTFGGDRASLASSSTSLRSGVLRYQFENGRRYHGYQSGSYNFPNDEQELNRMDIEHHNQLLQMGGRLHLCPLDNPREILDLGTGTGIWAIEMADQYPNCQILGTDLSPEQPEWMPPNCRFEVDDFELDWTFGDDRFDMIHHRFSLGSVSSYDMLYKRAYNALKPGGWIEIVDMESGTFSDDGSLPNDSALVQWGLLLQEAFHRLGKPILPIQMFPVMLQNQGFVNVHARMVKRPTNDWPKDPEIREIGRYCCLNLLEGLEGFTMAPFTRLLGWSKEEVDMLLVKVRAEIVKRSIHGWQKGIVCYAQKPLNSFDPSQRQESDA